MGYNYPFLAEQEAPCCQCYLWVCSGCLNKTCLTWGEGLEGRNVLSHCCRSQKSKINVSAGWGLLRSLSLACRWPPSPMSLRGQPWVCASQSLLTRTWQTGSGPSKGLSLPSSPIWMPIFKYILILGACG